MKIKTFEQSLLITLLAEATLRWRLHIIKTTTGVTSVKMSNQRLNF